VPVLEENSLVTMTPSAAALRKQHRRLRRARQPAIKGHQAEIWNEVRRMREDDAVSC
jgi:hypothetical protein